MAGSFLKVHRSQPPPNLMSKGCEPPSLAHAKRMFLFVNNWEIRVKRLGSWDKCPMYISKGRNYHLGFMTNYMQYEMFSLYTLRALLQPGPIQNLCGMRFEMCTLFPIMHKEETF